MPSPEDYFMYMFLFLELLNIVHFYNIAHLHGLFPRLFQSVSENVFSDHLKLDIRIISVLMFSI